MIKSDYQLLASVTVFRELYDTEKDIYDVLCIFIKHILISENKFTFTAEEITDILNDKFHFGLKKAVVKSALNRLSLPKKDNVYTNTLGSVEANINHMLEESQRNAYILFNELYSYIEKNNNIRLSEADKQDISIQFTDYLIDENTEGKYSSSIPLFLLSIEHNKSLIESVNRIKEGNLLYEGIRYCGNPAEIGSWTTELNIFLDTEILFSLAGYNGDLYRSNICEFFDYVIEINKMKSKGSGKINLWYFSEVKEEIEVFFSTAEKIVKRDFEADPSNIAMNNIVNGCEKASDIKIKYVSFIELLKKNHINLFDTSNMYEESNQIYNLLSAELLTAFDTTSISEKDRVYKSAIKINYINILRKNDNSKGFEHIGHILLTATGMTLKMANAPVFKFNHDVPKATYSDFLVNRFWYKLNKGFGANKTPKTIDVISKSRILLSSLINTQVSKKYDLVKEEYNEGKLPKSSACTLIAELHELTKLPENIDIQDIEDSLIAITRWDIQSAIDEYRQKSNEAQKFKEENQKLLEIQELQEKELKELRSDADKRKKTKQKIKNSLRFIYCTFTVVAIIACILVDAYFYAQGNKLAIGIATAICLLAIVPGVIKYMFLKKNSKSDSTN